MIQTLLHFPPHVIGETPSKQERLLTIRAPSFVFIRSIGIILTRRMILRLSCRSAFPQRSCGNKESPPREPTEPIGRAKILNDYSTSFCLCTRCTIRMTRYSLYSCTRAITIATKYLKVFRGLLNGLRFEEAILVG